MNLILNGFATVKVLSISYFFVIRFYWGSNHEISWYSICYTCHICWYTSSRLPGVFLRPSLIIKKPHSEFFLSIFIANKILKMLLTKIDLTRYYYFISIFIVYQNRAFPLVKFVFFKFSIIKLYNLLSIFIYSFRIFL